MNQKSSNKGLMITIMLLFLTIAGAVTYFYVLPTFFPKKAEISYHLEEFSEYEKTIEAVQTVEHNNITFQVPIPVSEYQQTYESTFYEDKNQKLTIIVGNNRKIPTSFDDLTAIGGTEAYEAFMKDFTDQDPYSDYAKTYVLDTVDTDKQVDGLDTASSLYRLIASQKKEYEIL